MKKTVASLNPPQAEDTFAFQTGPSAIGNTHFVKGPNQSFLFSSRHRARIFRSRQCSFSNEHRENASTLCTSVICNCFGHVQRGRVPALTTASSCCCADQTYRTCAPCLRIVQKDLSDTKGHRLL